tara:strand:+ start:706492 stop:712068 length:5577 start_codon:yes stop_codon:yes gene_type:complete
MKINFFQKFLVFIFFSSTILAQGPISPEASSFEPVDATDMVNLLTGDFSYVLPILEVPSPEGGYPLALSYHGGIAMGQEASWVGLGWNLNPGAITRNVTGVPDDWKNVKKYSAIFNQGGTSTSFSAGISLSDVKKSYSVGVYASYSTHKATGGVNSNRFDVGISGSYGFGVDSPFGLNGSLGTNGAGVGATLKGKMEIPTENGGTQNIYSGQLLSVNLNQSFINGSTSVSTSSSGIGISLSSSGISAGMFGRSFYSSGSNALSNSWNNYTQRAGLHFMTGVGAFNININLSYTKSTYWLYENEYSIFNGSVYAGKLDETFNNTPFDLKVAYDGFEISENRDDTAIENPNFNFASYDNYSVSGQGVSGSMTPYILEQGVLPLQHSIIKSDETNGFIKEEAKYFYPSDVQRQFSKSLVNSGGSKLHFYLDNEYSSYINVKSDNWEFPTFGYNYSSFFDIETLNRTTDYTFVKDGNIFQGYNPVNGRLRKGSYVEVYTNAEIISNSGLIIEADNFNRNDNNLYPSDGIGAYKITTLDGKVYHYSLPVYQRERFSKSTKLEDNIDEVFFAEEDLEPYATHWLLTGITGPDYVDVNSNGALDENDYGYWVKFEYGKWSNGYIWRNPIVNYEESDLSKSFSWGRKEIYYLDKVITRTHTALFIKSDREDGWSSEINISDGAGYKTYQDINAQRFTIGDDGFTYLTGVYNDFNFNGHSILPGYSVFSNVNYRINTYKHRSLKLDRIILLKNDAQSLSISKSNPNQSSPVNCGRIEINTDAILYNNVGQNIASDAATILDTGDFYGAFYGNVLDVGDLGDINDIYLLNEESIENIHFGHDPFYALSPGTPNSTATNQGKLTLLNVVKAGRENTSLIPPYRFEYNEPYIPYDNDQKDSWGYSSVNPASWSLNKIKTPPGGEILVEYEEDTYAQEAAVTNFKFDSRFEMKFLGSESGPKQVVFRNHGDNTPERDISFYDYFQIGQTSEINIKFIKDLLGNGATEYVADVNKVCTVAAVTNTTVTFNLPANEQQYERTEELCKRTNWTYYNYYNDVVSESSNWLREWQPNLCDEVGDGKHRIKIEFYSSKSSMNQNGGGLRVKRLAVADGEGNEYATNYSYLNPTTAVTSGTTSYAPSKRQKNIKYLSALPAPFVMYNYVTVEDEKNANDFVSKTVYEFKVLEPMQERKTSYFNEGRGFFMGDAISIYYDFTKYHDFKINGEDALLNTSVIRLSDNLSSIGRLNSKKTYNAEGQLLSRTINNYRYPSFQAQGGVSETFDSYKKIEKEFGEDYYYAVSSIKDKIQSPLISTETTNSLNTTTVYSVDHDFYSGQVLETILVNSTGEMNKSLSIPAYYISEYGGSGVSHNMGSKVNSPNNKNMLSQTAVNYELTRKNFQWYPIGVSINTWNNNWTYRSSSGVETTPSIASEKIWRKHKTFVWDGAVDVDGIFTDYSMNDHDSFDWSISATSQSDPWKEISEVTRYDHFSMPLETKDINNNYASSKYWYEDTKVIATSNAGYNEFFASGSEYPKTISSTTYVAPEVTTNGVVTSDRSHTGKNSTKVLSGQFAYKTVLKSGEHRAGRYLLSVWAHLDEYRNARVNINGTLESFNGETTHAGQWVQLNHYLDLSTSQETIYVTTAGAAIHYDDYRLHPIASSMSSYVYNSDDTLASILGANNLATNYHYDEMGRLTRIYEETVNSSITGGFKLSKQFENHYKATIIDPGQGDPVPGGPVNFIDIDEKPGYEFSTATLKGDSEATVDFIIDFDCGVVQLPSVCENIRYGEILIVINGEDDEIIPVYVGSDNGPFAVTLPNGLGGVGTAEFTIKYTNLENNTPGFLGHIKVTLVETTIGNIIQQNSFKDENSIYNEL